MSQITTHILDTTRGRPGEGISVFLYQQKNEDWREISIGTTNQDGRIPNFLNKDAVLDPGVYKIRFETQPYFEKKAIPTFYPFVEIAFQVTGNEHYHVPLLLTPFGYSTYRGS